MKMANNILRAHAKLFDQKEQKPFISVIVATRNGERYIGKILDSLVNQTYPKDRFEVIVVDGVSEDMTLKIVEKYKDHLNLRVFKNEKIRSTYAFNRGIEKAKGDFFMIVSAHGVLCKNFIEKDINTFFRVHEKEPKLAGVGGTVINKPENTFGKIVGLMYDSFFSGAKSCRYIRKPHFSDSVSSGVYDKKTVESNGKFDEDFIGAGNDAELHLRLQRRGYKMFTNPKIVTYYFPRSSFRKFLKQTFNYGVARGLMVRKGYHKIEWFNSASFWFIPVSFLFYELFLFAFSGFSFTLAFVPFILYWLINVSVSFNLLIKTKSVLCIILPVMYFMFHNVLGLASLMGLVFGKKAFL